jgi:hypothetical protein
MPRNGHRAVLSRRYRGHHRTLPDSAPAMTSLSAFQIWLFAFRR